MMLLAVMSWWYTTGWRQAMERAGQRIDGVLDAFSVGLLAGSLFEPFKQMSADTGEQAGTQLQAFGDRLFSRVFGAVIRTMFIVIGLIGALFAGVIGLIQIAVWPFVPLLPLVGIIAAVLGIAV